MTDALKVFQFNGAFGLPGEPLWPVSRYRLSISVPRDTSSFCEPLTPNTGEALKSP